MESSDSFAFASEPPAAAPIDEPEGAAEAEGVGTAEGEGRTVLPDEELVGVGAAAVGTAWLGPGSVSGQGT